MTPQELKKLPVGMKVYWTLTDGGDTGKVAKIQGRKCIKWDDGYITEGFDDWALKYVRVIGLPKAVKR